MLIVDKRILENAKFKAKTTEISHRYHSSKLLKCRVLSHAHYTLVLTLSEEPLWQQTHKVKAMTAYSYF